MSGYPERRSALLRWLKERPAHRGLTVSEIVQVSGLYDDGHGRYDRCLADLKHFRYAGQLWHDGGRPARWSG